MKSKEELKRFFENGDIPKQEEFWEWQDSYWHKDEKIPISTIEGLLNGARTYKVMGSKDNFASLPTNNTVGDVWNLLDNGYNYVWVDDLNNTAIAGWDKLSGIVDLSGYIPLTGTNNFTGSLAASDRNIIFGNSGDYGAEIRLQDNRNGIDGSNFPNRQYRKSLEWW